MTQASHALSLFDVSNYPTQNGDASRVVALGKNAIPASTDKRDDGSPTGSATREVLIGTLVWYSVSDAVRLTPELLREAIAAASLDATILAPRPPTPEAALTRAADAVQLRGARITEGRDGEPVDDELYANILVRPADRGVKQVVTEVLDRSENRLAYRPLASIYLDKGDGTDELVIERAEGVGLLPVEADAMRRLRRYYEFEKSHHDGEGARRVIGRALSLANAVPLRNSGGMYFVPKKPGEAEGEPSHRRTARNLLAFVEEVRKRTESAPNKTPRASQAMSVPLVDREEYRQIVAASLEEHVEKEARVLIREMGKLLKSEQAITSRRGRTFVERVKKLREGVAHYEELLEMRATEARTHLQTAMKQARGLLGRVEGPDDCGSSFP